MAAAIKRGKARAREARRPAVGTRSAWQSLSAGECGTRGQHLSVAWDGTWECPWGGSRPGRRAPAECLPGRGLALGPQGRPWRVCTAEGLCGLAVPSQGAAGHPPGGAPAPGSPAPRHCRTRAVLTAALPLRGDRHPCRATRDSPPAPDPTISPRGSQRGRAKPRSQGDARAPHAGAHTLPGAAALWTRRHATGRTGREAGEPESKCTELSGPLIFAPAVSAPPCHRTPEGRGSEGPQDNPPFIHRQRRAPGP